VATQTVRTRHATRPRPAQRPAPNHVRRVSGPLRPAPVGAPVRRGTTGVFERIRALPEHRIVDGLLRGRVWIWLVGLLLGGIVAMQVSMLKLNTGISRAVTTMGTVERQNANLEADIARLSASERVESAALAEGMVAPPAGSMEFLTARPDRDPKQAAAERRRRRGDGERRAGARSARRRRPGRRHATRRGSGRGDRRPGIGPCGSSSAASASCSPSS
jgi:hypothetical protein